MNFELWIDLLRSFCLTLILESLFFFLIGKRNKKDVLLLGMINLITNPVVVLLFWLTTYNNDWNPFFVMIPLELFAVCVEGYYYKHYGEDFERPYLFSLAINAFSFSVGLLLL